MACHSTVKKAKSLARGSFVMGILGSNQGFLSQSQTSYH